MTIDLTPHEFVQIKDLATGEVRTIFGTQSPQFELPEGSKLVLFEVPQMLRWNTEWTDDAIPWGFPCLVEIAGHRDFHVLRWHPVHGWRDSHDRKFMHADIVRWAMIPTEKKIECQE